MIRRRAHRRLAILAAAVLLALTRFADHRGWLLAWPAGDLSRYDNAAASVVSVIDGRTLDVDLPDAHGNRPTTRVRLWGVRAPDQDPPAAAQLLESLALHQAVLLRVEPGRIRDDDGAVLAHVVRGGDGRSLNEALLERGAALLEDRRAHSMMGRYAQLAVAAQRRIARSGPGAGDAVGDDSDAPSHDP